MMTVMMETHKGKASRQNLDEAQEITVKKG
jgi:hypothetical protein